MASASTALRCEGRCEVAAQDGIDWSIGPVALENPQAINGRAGQAPAAQHLHGPPLPPLLRCIVFNFAFQQSYVFSWIESFLQLQLLGLWNIAHNSTRFPMCAVNVATCCELALAYASLLLLLALKEQHFVLSSVCLVLWTVSLVSRDTALESAALNLWIDFHLFQSYFNLIFNLFFNLKDLTCLRKEVASPRTPKRTQRDTGRTGRDRTGSGDEIMSRSRRGDAGEPPTLAEPGTKSDLWIGSEMKWV